MYQASKMRYMKKTVKSAAPEPSQPRRQQHAVEIDRALAARRIGWKYGRKHHTSDLGVRRFTMIPARSFSTYAKHGFPAARGAHDLRGSARPGSPQMERLVSIFCALLSHLFSANSLELEGRPEEALPLKARPRTVPRARRSAASTAYRLVHKDLVQFEVALDARNCRESQSVLKKSSTFAGSATLS